MSVITIQCRLVASEDTRRHLWQLMAEKNTPLINELLEQIRIHPDMEQWLKKGKLPDGVIKPLCDSLSSQERFVNQPKRFYKSAIEVVEYIYKSWLALQKERQQKIDKKEHWLNMLKSDVELEQESNFSLNIIRAKAIEILPHYIANFEETNKPDIKKRNVNKTKKSKSKNNVATKSPPTKGEPIPILVFRH